MTDQPGAVAGTGWPPKMLTSEQAGFVRWLRVEQYYSWRGVARACSEAWGAGWDGNQIAGTTLCETAAAVYGEDAYADPWN